MSYWNISCLSAPGPYITGVQKEFAVLGDSLMELLALQLHSSYACLESRCRMSLVNLLKLQPPF